MDPGDDRGFRCAPHHVHRTHEEHRQHAQAARGSATCGPQRRCGHHLRGDRLARACRLLRARHRLLPLRPGRLARIEEQEGVREGDGSRSLVAARVQEVQLLRG